MPVIVNCKLCSKEVFVKPSRVKSFSYCSKECMKKAYTHERIKKVCIKCGSDFEVYNNNSRKNALFCSRKCMDEYYVGERHRNYKHGMGDKHPDTVSRRKEKMKKYYEANKDLIRHRCYKVKIKNRGLEPGHTLEEWLNLLSEYENKCYYCGVEMTREEGKDMLTKDHVVPVSKGGTDDISNIVPSCKSCNGSKADKLI